MSAVVSAIRQNVIGRLHRPRDGALLFFFGDLSDPDEQPYDGLPDTDVEPVRTRLGEDTPAAALALRAVAQLADVDRRRAAGVSPDGIVAVGVGEVAGAYAAGVLTRVDAVAVACAVARSVGDGRRSFVRFQVRAGDEYARRLCRSAPVPLALTGCPTTEDALLLCRAGDAEAARGHLRRRVTIRREELRSDAMHTQWAVRDLDRLGEELRHVVPQPPALPLFAATTGRAGPPDAPLDVTYWHWMTGHPAYLGEAVSAAVLAGFERVVDFAAGPEGLAQARAVARAHGTHLRLVRARGSARHPVVLRRTSRPPEPRASPTAPALADAELHHRLSRAGPVHYLPAEEAWLVLGHAEVRHVLAHAGEFSSRSWAAVDPSLLALDPPEHTPRRRALRPHLAPEAIRALGETADAIADDILAAQAQAQEFDVMAQFATPLVEGVVGRLIGLHPGDVPGVAALARGDGLEPDLDRIERAIAVADEPPALLSALTASGAFSCDDAAALVRFVWVAGTVTTRRLIAWAVAVLGEDRDLRARVSADQHALSAFLEEILRLHPPERLIWRTATCDTTLGGVTIPAGATVYASFAAANRDPFVFADPDSIRLDRPPHHLTFGAGAHRCPGARLARAEALAACRALLRRMPDFEVIQPRSARRFWNAFATPVFEELVIAPRGR